MKKKRDVGMAHTHIQLLFSSFSHNYLLRTKALTSVRMLKLSQVASIVLIDVSSESKRNTNICTANLYPGNMSVFAKRGTYIHTFIYIPLQTLGIDNFIPQTKRMVQHISCITNTRARLPLPSTYFLCGPPHL